MYVAHLSLHDFRSYEDVEIELTAGVTCFVGSNGQGKTNIVEAVDYLSRLTSHRVASDAPLVRQGADHAVVRAAVVRADRQALLEVEINPGRSNRARVNKSPLPRPRELVGMVRTVLFSPEDLALVKGDPSERRRFLDDLLVLRAPRFAGVRSDYDRVLKQRNALLKAVRQTKGGRRGPDEYVESTLAVWDQQLVRTGSELVAARLQLVGELQPLVAAAYAAVAKDARQDQAGLAYAASMPLTGPAQEGAETEAAAAPGQPASRRTRDEVADAMTAELGRRRRDELERGVTLVGPHRDELALTLGTMPVKGYASHGESWSFALALRLASYDLLRSNGDDPILILDDVFAELDVDRRARLAELVAGAEQVLVTAAVPADVPEGLTGSWLEVGEGRVAPR